MRITKVKLDNFECFYQSSEFELDSGINFVVGRNNSGKTMLINALTPNAERNPHRSRTTLPEPSPVDQESANVAFEVEYEFDEHELLKILRESGSRFHLPLAPEAATDSFGRPRRHGLSSGFMTDGSDRLRYLYDDQGPNAVDLDRYFHRFSLKGHDVHDCYTMQIEGRPGNSTDKLSFAAVNLNISSQSASNVCWSVIQKRIQAYVFRFQAERRVGATASLSGNFVLASDASNLAQVLHTLNNVKPNLFQAYIRQVASVFPSVKEILTIPRESDTEMTIGEYDPSFGLDHLRRSLALFGTGLGQVMAMLYVIHYNDTPQVIIIDEPHSFLHPGAIRSLLEIFQEHAHHQYILATHSPTAIMSVRNKRILLVQRQENISSAKSVNVRDNGQLEEALREVGSKRSDIFGMDAVIWVEGKTDETCFNLIMEELLPSGVQIIGLVNTGDLEDKKHAKLAENIYEKLSGGVGILPSALAFIFDGDKRPDDYDEADSANGRTRYLKRQNYESYFLDYSGIADILSDLINNESGHSPPQPCTVETVQTWIDDNKEKGKFYPDGKQYDRATWMEDINGAKFLSAMFRELAHPARKYKKVKDGEEITRRILAETPDQFQEIVDQIQSILDENNTPAPA